MLPAAPTLAEGPEPFVRRHVGPSETEIDRMLRVLGLSSLEELVDETVPASIRTLRPLNLPPPLAEHELLERARALAAKNEVWRSYIGMGYHDTVTPPVIRRGVLENPAWYTHYTPYQAEIAQGRLEALLNFQTAVVDLTGLEIANASLLDEASAAAEAMLMLLRLARRDDARIFFVSEDCHPQTVAVVRGRAEPIGVEVVVGDHRAFAFSDETFGALLQYPTTDGAVLDYEAFCDEAHRAGAFVAVAADLLALTVLRPPGEFGADVAVGSTQRFGVPLGYGGPHAAYFATREAFKRQVPGRLIGVTVDADGRHALRMALQTREQHIRRGKATSNICTAQVLLAVMAGAYAVYHGPEGLRRIAGRVHRHAMALAEGLRRLGHRVRHRHVFDTVRVDPVGRDAGAVRGAAEARRINLRYYGDGSVGVALDETTTAADLDDVLAAFAGSDGRAPSAAELLGERADMYEGPYRRTTPYLEHEVFHRYRSEAGLTRYLHRLAAKDFSLADCMIPLGSCTMKLNPTAALEPVSWPEFARLHPFAPAEQAAGLREAMAELEAWLCELTGFSAASLQPNSGATGEYAGMLLVRAYHRSRGEAHRRVCLVPDSAHGTNPASAAMAGMEVVVVQSDEGGNVDLVDLRQKAERHRDRLAALMITYPSTHGVFEEDVRAVCEAVHACGGQVYFDGANMNAMAGLCRPAELGADLCHLNLHKTFAVPHGGGGPGAGPVCVAGHLAPFLPGHPVVGTGGERAVGPVAAAPYGSALITLVSWAYLAMLGGEGVRRASEVAVLSANYLAERLAPHYDVVYRGTGGRVAHEFILDLRPFRASAGVTEQDVAKRLMDYGFHAPTVSWPVGGGLMVEPTESESKRELDRFVEAMSLIRDEIRAVERGEVPVEVSALRQAPHPAAVVTATAWDRPYSREQAAYPAPWLHEHKVWPAVRRVDEAFGDRNLVCACPPVEAYAE